MFRRARRSLSYNSHPMKNKESATVRSQKKGVREKGQLMSASEIDRSLRRLALEVVERNGGPDGLVLVGVHRRGVPLARRLAQMIATSEKTAPPVETLDIT